MTRYTSTVSKRTRTIAQMLIVATITAVIVAITACSREQPPPTHRPQTEDRSPMQTMEAMAAEIAALQTQAAELTEITVDDGRTPTKGPSTAVAPATATATATPAPTATLPTPSGRGICSRTPEIQKLILSTLGLASCRSVTTDELYRITYFTDRPIGGSRVDRIEFPLKPGDFAGLVNLQELTIAGDFTIDPGTFQGARIKHVEISVATLTEGWAHGMLGLETLHIRGAEIPPLRERALEALKTLNIDTGRARKFPELSGEELEALTGLEELTISGYLFPDGTDINEIPKKADPPLEYKIPAGLLRNNVKLKKVRINIQGSYSESSNYRLVVAHNMAQHLSDLEAIGIIDDHPLSLHPSSPLHRFLNNPNVSE